MLRTPGAGVVATGLLLFANAIFAYTSAGNFVSSLCPAGRDLVASNGDVPGVLGLPTADFEAAWHEFLEERLL